MKVLYTGDDETVLKNSWSFIQQTYFAEYQVSEH